MKEIILATIGITLAAAASVTTLNMTPPLDIANSKIMKQIDKQNQMNQKSILTSMGYLAKE